jgi:flagellar motor switch protein FliN/FliY
MADEEKLEGGEELKDQNDESRKPQESDAEIAVDQDGQFMAADENPDAEAQDSSKSAESSVDDLVEQQMLAELEKVESEGSQGTVLSAEKGEVNEQDVQRPEYPTFGKTTSAVEQKNLDLLLDVNLPISIELGRTTMRIKDILSLGPGSVVELKKLAGEPVDLLVNDKIVAKGEVVVVDENFGLRITSLLSPEERLRSLND